MALDLVFPNGNGAKESHANVVNRGLTPATISAGVTVATGKPDKDGLPIMAAKCIGLHSLRHFFASLCINPADLGRMALSPKVAQERLGHASIQMTYDLYGHLFPKGDTTSEVDAADRALLGWNRGQIDRFMSHAMSPRFLGSRGDAWISGVLKS